ncbi:hypothetical protein ASPSYDRAFT_90976 [Aspergillus sydowii CBS 593.65]|uniref:MYND-type domain-containing protein n=1 Tax=Aspergillus sydowii CBS 593.65 TaxID=1036612 RepID=A0A1L9TE78_9EURO|nr:uncharacterized protein ASPSYDRAFT_90976 [Aspergillus sydowii CBS 593.65]OJJ57691.1 hypothetical protein ASPSYDRAFT_90976 [Aspergillus sydowii CBS 593.65]
MFDITCTVCAEKESNDTTFVCCARCKTQYYCSRKCLESNWESHKRTCCENSDSSYDSFNSLGNGLCASMHSPYRRLLNRTWLHDRPKEEVYKLLIDAYRLYRDDRSVLTRQVSPDGIYRGVFDSRDEFCRFLNLAESRHGLLPSWWSYQNTGECLSRGMCDDWSCLAVRVNYSGIIEHYKDTTFASQLKVIARQIYGDMGKGVLGALVERFKALEEELMGREKRFKAPEQSKDLEEELEGWERRLNALEERFKRLVKQGMDPEALNKLKELFGDLSL